MSRSGYHVINRGNYRRAMAKQHAEMKIHAEMPLQEIRELKEARWDAADPMGSGWAAQPAQRFTPEQFPAFVRKRFDPE